MELAIHLQLLRLNPGSEFSKLEKDISSDQKSEKAVCFDWAEWSRGRDLTGKEESPGVRTHLWKTHGLRLIYTVLHVCDQPRPLLSL